MTNEWMACESNPRQLKQIPQKFGVINDLLGIPTLEQFYTKHNVLMARTWIWIGQN